jgi:polysaccharide export outer membrane protein
MSEPMQGTYPKSNLSHKARAACRVAAFFFSLTVFAANLSAGPQDQRSAARVLPTFSGPLQHNELPPRSDQFQYFVAPDDLLDIYVVDVPELSREYRVSPDGSLSIPLLPAPITAQGLTPDQLSAVISDRLRTAKMVSYPHVVVTVKTSRVHSVTIMGAVKRPQIYPVFGTTTLLDVLSQAEGLADDAGNTVIVTRGAVAKRVLSLNRDLHGPPPASSSTSSVKVNLRELLESGDSRLNVTVFPGDKVTVERAGIIYVVGAVNRPGGFTLKSDHENMTVLKAVALGEGLTATALRKKAMIIRQGPKIPGGRQEIVVNLTNVLAGRAPDQELRPNDILFVPDSTSSKALRRGAEAALQIATGVIIFRR